jgi:hypothetical protein
MSAAVALMVNGLHVRGPFSMDEAKDTAAWLFEGAEEGERCFAFILPLDEEFAKREAELDAEMDLFVEKLMWARECSEEEE